MNTSRFHSLSSPTFYTEQQITPSQITQLNSINEKLQMAFDQLQLLQKELNQKEKLLACAYQTIEQNQQQLQATHHKIREQAVLLNEVYNGRDPSLADPPCQERQNLGNLGILAGRIAHDLNNILTPILTLTQLLRMNQANLLDQQSQQWIEIIECTTRRGIDLVKQITSAAHPSTEASKAIQVLPLLEEVLNTVQITLPESITIYQYIPNQPVWLVAADSTRLHQVFMNLCINARDAMLNGGVLGVSVENCVVDHAFTQKQSDAQAGKYVVTTITDTGIGILPEVRDRMFEPFFTTKREGQGTGLGLTTVQGIVKTCGGFLQVFSQVGEGTSIKVYLPAVEAIPGRLDK